MEIIFSRRMCFIGYRFHKFHGNSTLDARMHARISIKSTSYKITSVCKFGFYLGSFVMRNFIKKIFGVERVATQIKFCSLL